MNVIMLSGFVSSVPVTTAIKTGSKVTNFNLAVKDDRKNAQGEYPTYYFRISAWGIASDFCEKYVKRDNFVNVVGKLVQDKWIDKVTGKAQYHFHIVADHVENSANGKGYKRGAHVNDGGVGNGLLDYVDGNSSGNADMTDSVFT